MSYLYIVLINKQLKIITMNKVIFEMTTTESREWMDNAGFGDNWGQVGFANVILKSDNKGNSKIELSSSYHSEDTLKEMFDCNGKGWQKR